jgi:hypothetical protein
MTADAITATTHTVRGIGTAWGARLVAVNTDTGWFEGVADTALRHPDSGGDGAIGRSALPQPADGRDGAAGEFRLAFGALAFRQQPGHTRIGMLGASQRRSVAGRTANASRPTLCPTLLPNRPISADSITLHLLIGPGQLAWAWSVTSRALGNSNYAGMPPRRSLKTTPRDPRRAPDHDQADGSDRHREHRRAVRRHRDAVALDADSVPAGLDSKLALTVPGPVATRGAGAGHRGRTSSTPRNPCGYKPPRSHAAAGGRDAR